jgi:hypothetical protein
VNNSTTTPDLFLIPIHNRDHNPISHPPIGIVPDLEKTGQFFIDAPTDKIGMMNPNVNADVDKRIGIRIKGEMETFFRIVARQESLPDFQSGFIERQLLLFHDKVNDTPSTAMTKTMKKVFSQVYMKSILIISVVDRATPVKALLSFFL